MLATFGYAEVPVAKKPIVGLYATGTELLEVKDPLVPGKIRNSNSYMIAAQIERAGAKADYFGSLPDDFDTCFEAVKESLDKVDMLITTGGVSVGDFDYMPAIYEKLGAEVLFNKVGMRPGSVTTVAHFNGKLLFGLSGNPSACYVGFELFARPIIRMMLCSKKPHLRKELAILDTDFPKANPFTRFVRSTVSFQNGRLIATPSGLDKSNIVMSLAGANSLMILPGGTRGFEAGTEVEVLLLDDQEGSEWPW
jgi:molybdopterin molybdotransferase